MLLYYLVNCIDQYAGKSILCYYILYLRTETHPCQRYFFLCSNLNNPLHYTISVHYFDRSEKCLELDLFLLQCCAALAPEDLFVSRILERFGLSNYLCLNVERSSEYVLSCNKANFSCIFVTLMKCLNVQYYMKLMACKFLNNITFSWIDHFLLWSFSSFFSQSYVMLFFSSYINNSECANVLECGFEPNSTL